ncbi:hypothetical protein KSP39_PZI008239 [Platanthera zijinensis]|uniref:Uncharacterized protein n=1 Tax=Platanthera zijinensis TaxID=2320716 RepID=A0AAP0BMT1_9ASPA
MTVHNHHIHNRYRCANEAIVLVVDASALKEKVDPNRSGVIASPNFEDQLTPAPVLKDNLRMDNRHRPLTQRSYTRSQVNASDARAQSRPFHSNVIEVKAKRLPFSSNMETQSRTHICDAKTAKQRSLRESSSDSSAAGEAGGHNARQAVINPGEGEKGGGGAGTVHGALEKR